MASGSDVRQALQAGLWKALADGSDRAAMRATCRDARDMVDELHDSGVMPVGPSTWDSAATIAAYHLRLGAVQSLHVRYSAGAGDDARVARFVDAYSAALGAALPAGSCTITMSTAAGTQLCSSFAAALLARVVPHVERLDMALGSYDNLPQLLTLLQPCMHLRSLRLLPPDDDTDGPRAVSVGLDTYHSEGRVLDALCGLTRLHTLSGPWVMKCGVLERLCAALPSLATLGFCCLHLGYAAGACISRQLHTLAGWRHSACDDGGAPRYLPSSHPWHLLDKEGTGCIFGVCNLQSSLPAVQHLDSVVLGVIGDADVGAALAAVAAATQRFAACAERWAWKAGFQCELVAARGLAPGSLASMQHMVVELGALEPTRAATYLRCLIAAAPSITMLALRFSVNGRPPEALQLAAMLKPLCGAAHLHTLRLTGRLVTGEGVSVPADPPALWPAEVVRGLALPNAEGKCCRALRHLRLAGAGPEDLQACRLALADGGVDVSVDECPMEQGL